MPIRLTWILVFVASSVQAQSALVGRKLIARGDSIERVREAGEAPDRIDRIEGDGASPPIEIWTYARKGRTITLWVVDRKVVQVEDGSGRVR